eukprot:9295422-Karenia_brevis.AAC.1
MAAPTVNALEHLKHVARFLKGKPKACWSFYRQNLPKFVDGFSDSNWAGCLVTRKSTTSTCLTFGRHCIATASFTQS